MKLKIYISLLISFLSYSLFAQQAELSVTISKNKLGLNERLRVEFSINKQGGDNFTPPKFKDFKLVAGPSQSVSQSWINGRVTFSQSYTYILKPNRKGELFIEAASIEINGSTINSKMMRVVVTDPIDIPENPNDPEYIANQNIHLVAEVSKSNPYVGEGIYVEYRLYVSENVSVYETSVTEAPQYNGFWNQEITIDGYPVKMGKFNGENYRYIVLQKALLIPTKTGNLTIDPMKMDIVIGVPTGRADFFGNVITKNVRKEFASPKKIINPKNLPLKGRPENFTGAVGNFIFNVSLSKEVLKANESSQIKIDVSGKGNLKLFELPLVETPTELEKYQPERKENIQVTIDGIQGSVNDTYTIVPQYKGKYKIPSVSFSFFNPKEEKYKTISTADMYVDVTEGKEIETSNNSNSTNSIEKQNVISTGNSFRYILTKTVFEPRETADFYNSNLFYLLLLLPFLTIPMGIFIAKRNEERNSDLVGIRLRKAEKLAKKFLSEAQKQLGKKEAFYEALERALHNYLKAKLNIETADISKEKITQILEEKKVAVETISKFIEVLKSSDFARYTPVTNIEMNKEFEKAKAVIVQLDKQL
ncbi:MAG: protein BatD [Flavobacteriia bacterium]|nr:protein BatD [Flavobacteriia bacterium]OIP47849.1 MAG: BatD protein [Flavobacteriaceae bacterium CG2_30_31_66]PIV97214.1 MAG: BatD protein [Flavobacteriaceae bacterium CG17_big_fil_post_rev_8_21_14_2_50_31_13]PIX15183.1 MAG: BatD protein [Flavobacteriaceae bacterium CG_4_8_14_3_um_filter_31_8]PIY15888.1 MAG: BatD protein [Flavobacteriaceae bacterium CG_4_10_14_3_um_filter_31_253]